MFKRRNKKRSVLLTLLLTLLLAVAAYAFTAANTFPGGAPAAGDGSATISGYQVSAISYTVNEAVSPATITAWKFRLNSQPQAGAVVKSSLVPAAALTTCSETDVPTIEYTCTPASAVDMTLATSIRVLVY